MEPPVRRAKKPLLSACQLQVLARELFSTFARNVIRNCEPRCRGSLALRVENFPTSPATICFVTNRTKYSRRKTVDPRVNDRCFKLCFQPRFLILHFDDFTLGFSELRRRILQLLSNRFKTFRDHLSILFEIRLCNYCVYDCYIIVTFKIECLKLLVRRREYSFEFHWTRGNEKYRLERNSGILSQFWKMSHAHM